MRYSSPASQHSADVDSSFGIKQKKTVNKLLINQISVSQASTQKSEEYLHIICILCSDSGSDMLCYRPVSYTIKAVFVCLCVSVW